MKPKHGLVLSAVFVALAVYARQPSPSVTGEDLLVPEDDLVNPPTEPGYTSAPEATTINKDQNFTRPIDAEFPKHEDIRADDPESQPWANSQGWRPGTSAFPDAATHESKLVLFSFKLESAPKGR